MDVSIIEFRIWSKKAKSPRTATQNTSEYAKSRSAEAGAQGRCVTGAGRQRSGLPIPCGGYADITPGHAVRVLTPGAGLGLSHLRVSVPIVTIAHRTGVNK